MTILHKFCRYHFTLLILPSVDTLRFHTSFLLIYIDYLEKFSNEGEVEYDDKEKSEINEGKAEVDKEKAEYDKEKTEVNEEYDKYIASLRSTKYSSMSGWSTGQVECD